MSQQYTLQEWLMAIAMNNDAFRQRLLHDPREALADELGLSLPQGVTMPTRCATSWRELIEELG